jgi:WD40 repeat protein
MKKIAFLLFTTGLWLQLTAQSYDSDKYRMFQVPENHYPIFGMTVSPDQKELLVSGWGGRLYLLDVQKPGTEVLLWKNFGISGFKFGSKPVFSQDGKYILMVETIQWTSFWSLIKVKPRKCVVLEAASGKVVFSRDGIMSAGFVNGTSQIAVSENDRIRFFDFLTGEKSDKIEVDDIEVLAVSHDGKTIAASYDPEKRELRELESVGKNKGELRNAKRAKRLVAFFDVATGKRIATSSDEIDIIIYMEFAPDDSKVIYAVRSKGKEGGTKQLAQFGMGRINVPSGEIDRNFFHYSNDAFLDFSVSHDQQYFAFVDDPGAFGFKKRVLVYEYENMDSRQAMFGYQGKLFNPNLYSPCFAMRTDTSLLYLSNGNKVIEWDYKKLPEYLLYTEPTNPDAVADTAVSTLNRELVNGKLREFLVKNDVHGLFIFDITLHKKGEVATVFTQSDEKTDIRSQNLLKDYIRQMRFDVKMPKDQRVKFRYTFDIE